MFKALTFLTLVLLALSIDYPLYRQCDETWGHQNVGTSNKTICKVGSLLTSVAMALKGIGKDQINPSTLNKWLTSNKGYVNDYWFVWDSINKWGVSYQGQIINEKIVQYISKGYIVLINVKNGRHWALARGSQKDCILVNDPKYNTDRYSLKDIVYGRTAVYAINKLPNFAYNWLLSIQELTNSISGKEKEYQTVPADVDFQEDNNMRRE